MTINNFSMLRIGLASPEKIIEWSHGEVQSAETIEYKSQKPVKGGLFCERIFGPVKDWECNCGKKINDKGKICPKCGIEITRKIVRRERMGHITLAAPIAHIWFFKGQATPVSRLLEIMQKDLDSIVYFRTWIVTDPGDSDLQYKAILSEQEYRRKKYELRGKYFEAMTGAAAIEKLLKDLSETYDIHTKEENPDGMTNLQIEYEFILRELEEAKADRRKKLLRRLEIIEAFLNSGNKPEWMVLNVLPVLPPDLRPLLQLDGGRFAASDLNELYRRVILRNQRLKDLMDMHSPELIVHNEMRLLQEAVDSLIDNERSSRGRLGAANRELKSLSLSLKGKQGRFRKNLLGKRVDFSGRSVIAIGPTLKMGRCVRPKEMAIQLYKPFIINEMVFSEMAPNPRTAEKMITKQEPRVWDVVEEVIVNHPVFLNRAPTLHRLGIQAFFPKLVEGRAIRVHPLVCPAFNADFDGDQMAVHLPLSEMARAETEILMLGSNNILGPKDGKPIVTPGQDLVLGNFYLNMEETAEEFYRKADALDAIGEHSEADRWRRYGDNEGHVFKDINEILMAYQTGVVHLHNRIALPACKVNKTTFTEEQQNSYLLTTVGKIIFNDVLPPEFPYINEVNAETLKRTPDSEFVPIGTDIRKEIQSRPLHAEFKKSSLGELIAAVFDMMHTEGTSDILDGLKDMGYLYSTLAGMTVAMSDISVAPDKERLVEYGKKQADTLSYWRERGLLADKEWETKFQALWEGVKDDVGSSLMKSLPRMNPIKMMSDSGARGNKNHFTQLAGMRGVMGRPTQSKSRKEYQPSIIEVPIYSCFREGMSVSEFFISTHGVRKGLTDTALKTAESGYLTRRLVDVAQEVIIKEDDCETDQEYIVTALVDRKNNRNTSVEHLYDRIVGRYTKKDVIDPATGEVVVEGDTYLTDELADRIVKAGVQEVSIRNVFTCACKDGICRKCYGRNMATGNLVEEGEAIGVMAAQAIGEPGTQLTMRNFHTGGVATKSGDITQGLPRVEELFEAREPKGKAVISKVDGEIVEIIPPSEDKNGNKTGAIIRIRQDIGNLEEDEEHEAAIVEHKCDVNHVLRGYIKEGEHVFAGQKLTEGQIAPKELLEVAGVAAVQEYILKEVKKVYNAQSIDISDKHIEVMIRQMMKKVKVKEGNDSGLSEGQTLSLAKITDINERLVAEDKNGATYSPMLLGITKSAVETDSFLSAASFQETTKVLTDAAVKGKIDKLQGLKENVIIGKLIPAGTGRQFDRETTRRIERRAAELKAIREEKVRKHREEQANAKSMPSETTGNGEYHDAAPAVSSEE